MDTGIQKGSWTNKRAPGSPARVKGAVKIRTLPARCRNQQERREMFRKILFGAVSILAMAMGGVQAQDLKEF
ncbi:MAG: hypothetical protein E5W39_18850, partial [Mesorhizobium sp.]